jgi:succinate-semialdehyde dehydrogenase / glutarate-semialdehyde dehydrogenase
MTMDLNRRTQSIYVGGRWVDAAGQRNVFDVLNPADGERLTTVVDAGAADTTAAIDAAAAVQKDWANTPAGQRSMILRKAHDLMTDRTEELARLMTMEQGKPLAEARAEVGYAKSFLLWFAGEAERIFGRLVPANDPTRRIAVIRRPIGIVAAITPWNFPAAMVTRKVAPALAAGCPVVLKPSELTPLSALAITEILVEAGLPSGVLSTLCASNPKPFADMIFADPRVRKITFTGSTVVGKELIRRSADTVKAVSLELGGNAPFIVCDDADLEAAIDGLMIAKMRNAGQTCLAANRIYVHRSRQEEFVRLLTTRMSELRLGNGMDEGVTVGPLINGNAVAKVNSHVRNAVALGARLELGGKVAGGLLHYEPTVLSNVGDEALLTQEETFGPVAAVLPFDTDDEVLARANSTNYGLAAYVYTRDLARINRLADELEFGIIGVNDGFVSVAQAPFGGLKESGLGREGGSEGIDGFLETKYLSVRA